MMFIFSPDVLIPPGIITNLHCSSQWLLSIRARHTRHAILYTVFNCGNYIVDYDKRSLCFRPGLEEQLNNGCNYHAGKTGGDGSRGM